ncbi:hypothetical protein I6F65_03025 [Pseudoalteromonas sp. SWXJZ94C]|uniref:hypothetical protein n=1 Tax=Pseudoalteromonas sp. SWXJZ94C TaxID=2792065 RepID=UPI0018CCC888|nr:hypothetical protein [Pseudoalteromonas sp. SWXJZ94C]MBH0055922.1 hypothetical protein [Pseudoalteromonas sp. SWXJZ94C]
MNLSSSTKNQHFLSAYEQSVNSINPNALKRSSKKIYSFTLKNREALTYNLDNRKGTSIENNLSAFDLFSFDVIDKDIRLNFERFYTKYESILEVSTTSLISKIQNNDRNVKVEICNLFVIKFLNFIRNPYCIDKLFHTFSDLKTLQPVDPTHLKNYKKFLMVIIHPKITTVKSLAYLINNIGSGLL